MTMWRSSLLALTAAAGLAGGATLAAADGPGDWGGTPWTWNGVYAGVNLGTIDSGGNNSDLVGGVQLGRNWQSGKMVYSLEGDIDFADSDNIDFIGTVRGRLGFLMSPGILAYGTAGIGVINEGGGGGGSKGEGNGNGNGGNSNAELVVGLGVEGKITNSSTVRLEWINFNDSNVDIIRAGM
ncbi:MAG: outer membrane beta-barrel protein, partial [Hyphomicrobiaceae bacterium]|nr:outer membrane beta-barrel protein [Hyphomicrobiaceae bacterium]